MCLILELNMYLDTPYPPPPPPHPTPLSPPSPVLEMMDTPLSPNL